MPYGLCPSPARTGEHGSFPPTPAVQHTVHRETWSASSVERRGTPRTSYLPQSLKATPLAPGVNGAQIRMQAGCVAERIRTLDQSPIRSFTELCPGTPETQHRYPATKPPTPRVSGGDAPTNIRVHRLSSSSKSSVQAGCAAAGIRFSHQPSIFTGSLRGHVTRRWTHHESASGVEQGLSSPTSQWSNSSTSRSQVGCVAERIRTLDRSSIRSFTESCPGTPETQHRHPATKPPTPRVSGGDALTNIRVHRVSFSSTSSVQAGCAAGSLLSDQPSILTGSLRGHVIRRWTHHESASGVEQGLSSPTSQWSNSSTSRSQAGCVAERIRTLDQSSVRSFTESRPGTPLTQHRHSATTIHPPTPRVSGGDVPVHYRVQVNRSGVHSPSRPDTRMCHETLGGPERGTASTTQDRGREAPLVSPVGDTAVHARTPSTLRVTSFSR